ncbi:MAG: ABC transporter permease [Candidatus Brocadiia bacterium]
MTAYIIRRTLYTIPLVFGVCLITFFIFECLFTPEDRAARELGKGASPEAIQEKIRTEGWDTPLLLNPEADGLAAITQTRFVQHMKRLLTFRFGRSEKTNEDILEKIKRGMVPSLTLTVPIFILGLFVSICLSLMVAYFRATYLDIWVVVICVAFMSISILVYIIGGQVLLAQHLKLFPVYGYAPGINSVPFLLLPVLIAILKGLGGNVRFYRTVFLEEVNRDYVRTARAKGLGERLILFKHVLKNAMVPILTRTVIAIPFLFLGSLLLERFFGIPGLGNMTVEAIESGDFPVISAMVYMGAILFAVGNLLTDISYTFVDPRVALR